jgi:hypothetical protein
LEPTQDNRSERTGVGCVRCATLIADRTLVLAVQLHTPNPQPIPFVCFDDVACFEHFYLALEIKTRQSTRSAWHPAGSTIGRGGQQAHRERERGDRRARGSGDHVAARQLRDLRWHDRHWHRESSEPITPGNWRGRCVRCIDPIELRT